MQTEMTGKEERESYKRLEKTQLYLAAQMDVQETRNVKLETENKTLNHNLSLYKTGYSTLYRQHEVDYKIVEKMADDTNTMWEKLTPVLQRFLIRYDELQDTVNYVLDGSKKLRETKDADAQAIVEQTKRSLTLAKQAVAQRDAVQEILNEREDAKEALTLMVQLQNSMLTKMVKDSKDNAEWRRYKPEFSASSSLEER